MHIHGLPFRFDVEGDPTAGGTAELLVSLTPPVPQQGFDQLRSVVAWYATLGQLGGLGGATLPPESVTALLSNDAEPMTPAPQATWRFEVLRIDPKSLVILANLVFATGLHVERVALYATGAASPVVYLPDDYPELYRQVPFDVDDARTDRNVEIVMTFERELPEVRHPAVSDMLRVWTIVAALGGFRQIGPLRAGMDLLPEDDPDIVLDELRLSVRDNGLHDAAYDVLTNLTVRLERSGHRLKQLSMR